MLSRTEKNISFLSDILWEILHLPGTGSASIKRNASRTGFSSALKPKQIGNSVPVPRGIIIVVSYTHTNNRKKILTGMLVQRLFQKA
jgi:hypothetical protein